MGGNYSGNAAAYALVRTFSDNEENSDIFVTSFSSAAEGNQLIITNVFNNILKGLNSGKYPSCSTWLTGAAAISISDDIGLLLTGNAYGHGPFNDSKTAAFVGTRNKDGTLTGTPASAAITVNDTGAFFNAMLGKLTFTVGPHAYSGGTLKAQASILIHELGHLMKSIGGANGFLPDVGEKEAGRSNDHLVDLYCGKLIGGLK
jgi:hypothetical protein